MFKRLSVALLFAVIAHGAAAQGPKKGANGGDVVVSAIGISGVMALGAVSYNPNPVHLATILPVFAIVAAEGAEVGLEAVGGPVRVHEDPAVPLGGRQLHEAEG